MPSTSPTTFFGWVVFLLEQYGPLFLRGAGMTMLIAISGTILGFLIGLLVGIARTIELGPRAPIWKRALVRLLNAVLGIYIEVFRGTPMIVQAMVIYYGIPYMGGPQLGQLQAAILIVSINTGAYMAEIVRGGIISIDRGQTEAARSIGMTHWQTMVDVYKRQHGADEGDRGVRAQSGPVGRPVGADCARLRIERAQGRRRADRGGVVSAFDFAQKLDCANI